MNGVTLTSIATSASLILTVKSVSRKMVAAVDALPISEAVWLALAMIRFSSSGNTIGLLENWI